MQLFKDYNVTLRQLHKMMWKNTNTTNTSSTNNNNSHDMMNGGIINESSDRSPSPLINRGVSLSPEHNDIILNDVTMEQSHLGSHGQGGKHLRMYDATTSSASWSMPNEVDVIHHHLHNSRDNQLVS